MSDNRHPPAVSVVTSVFNGGRSLRASLGSVLRQQGIDFEVIVVDDGSTDDSPAVLEELAHSHAHLRILRQQNQGLTRALVHGCARARGRWIARHDSDDLSLPGRLANQARLLEANPHLSMVSCWAQALGPEDEPLYDIQRPAHSEVATDLLLHQRQGPPHHGSVMFCKGAYEQVGGYRPEFYFSQDSDLWLRLGEVGQIGYVPEVLYRFRVTEGSISSRYREVQHRLGELAHACRAARRAGTSEEGLLTQAAALRPESVVSLRADPLAGAYFIGRCLLRRRDPRARRYLRKVLRRRPWRLGAWVGFLQSYFMQSST
jgi:glycosyltransferase involved in cell wall biosynthesis